MTLIESSRLGHPPMGKIRDDHNKVCIVIDIDERKGSSLFPTKNLSS